MNQVKNSEIKVLKFDIGYLFACIPMLACEAPENDDRNRALECVIIGDGFMGASNGAAMVIVNKDIFKDCAYLLSGGDVEALYKHIVSTQAIDSNFYIDDFELRFISDVEAIAVINHGKYEHSIDLMGYIPPDFKLADIAEPEAVNLKTMEMPYFDPNLLALLMQSASMYAGNLIEFVRVIPTGLKTVIYVEMTADMHGVIMPADVNANTTNVLGKHIDS